MPRTCVPLKRIDHNPRKRLMPKVVILTNLDTMCEKRDQKIRIDAVPYNVNSGEPAPVGIGRHVPDEIDIRRRELQNAIGERPPGRVFEQAIQGL